MSYLSLTVLGPPVVLHSEQEVSFSTRKQLALLLYLAVEGGSHSRQSLSELFWPDLDAEHGRSALRTTIMRLREALADPPSPHDYLLSDRNTLSLDPQAGISLDLHTAQEAWRLTRATTGRMMSLSAETRSELLHCLEQTTRLVRGSFLQGFSLRDAPGFDDWARAQREHWHLRLSTLFATLGQRQEEAGELEQAIAPATRWLHTDPLSEDAYQCLMRLHLATGNRAAALRAYDACRVMLSQELEVEPAHETEVLLHRIRSATIPASVKRMSRLSPGHSAPASTLLEGPLVGRGTEFRTLIDVYSHAASGQAQAVVIEGEAGMGKTRLASEFTGWVRAQGADVVIGQAFETGGLLPYQPLVDALRRRLDIENAPDNLLEDVWLAELSRVLPDLRARYPDLPRPLTDEAVGQVSLFEALTRLLLALSERAPLVLLLDDLHWVETPFLDLVRSLTRRFQESGAHILVLLIARSTVPTESSPFEQWATKLTHDLPTTRLSLCPLTSADIIQFLQGLADDTRQPLDESTLSTQPSSSSSVLEDAAYWLFTQTQGQPLALRETLRALLGQKVPREGEPWVMTLFTTLQAHAAQQHGSIVQEDRFETRHHRVITSSSSNHDNEEQHVTIVSTPTNLPMQLSSFIGRENEIIYLKQLLSTTRLLTLTGAGGCGKTRLGLQVASGVLEVYRDGVWLVELASLTDSSLVAQSVGVVLGIHERAEQSVVETLLHTLHSKQILLVLDNCEHVIEACAEMVEYLLRSCPQVSVLATSREALKCAGERRWIVPSLPRRVQLMFARDWGR